MESIEVLVIPRVSDQVLERIAKLDPRIKVVDVRGWFDVELRASWPQWTIDRYLGNRGYPASTRTAQPRLGLGADRPSGLAAIERFI